MTNKGKFNQVMIARYLFPHFLFLQCQLHIIINYAFIKFNFELSQFEYIWKLWVFECRLIH